MKSILMSFSIYWLYLIFEDIKREEARKAIPTSEDWNKRVICYAGKNKRELMRIPTAFREKYRRLMGKVVGEFICDSIRKGRADNLSQAYCHNSEETCLTDKELVFYATRGKPLYFLHISDLKAYVKPKELGEFSKPRGTIIRAFESQFITTPPQSWRYMEA